MKSTNLTPLLPPQAGYLQLPRGKKWDGYSPDKHGPLFNWMTLARRAPSNAVLLFIYIYDHTWSSREPGQHRRIPCEQFRSFSGLTPHRVRAVLKELIQLGWISRPDPDDPWVFQCHPESIEAASLREPVKKPHAPREVRLEAPVSKAAFRQDLAATDINIRGESCAVAPETAEASPDGGVATDINIRAAAAGAAEPFVVHGAGIQAEIYIRPHVPDHPASSFAPASTNGNGEVADGHVHSPADGVSALAPTGTDINIRALADPGDRYLPGRITLFLAEVHALDDGAAEMYLRPFGRRDETGVLQQADIYIRHPNTPAWLPRKGSGTFISARRVSISSPWEMDTRQAETYCPWKWGCPFLSGDLQAAKPLSQINPVSQQHTTGGRAEKASIVVSPSEARPPARPPLVEAGWRADLRRWMPEKLQVPTVLDDDVFRRIVAPLRPDLVEPFQRAALAVKDPRKWAVFEHVAMDVAGRSTSAAAPPAQPKTRSPEEIQREREELRAIIRKENEDAKKERDARRAALKPGY